MQLWFSTPFPLIQGEFSFPIHLPIQEANRQNTHAMRQIMITETEPAKNGLNRISGNSARQDHPGAFFQPSIAAKVDELPVLNWTEAVRRLEGDDQLLCEMATLFLTNYPDQFAKIAEAVENNDAGGLEIHAHTLKGTARVFCAEGVAAAAANLEQLGEHKNFAPALEGLERLRLALGRLQPELKEKAISTPAQ